MTIKMIVTDLDRTLLRKDKTISGYTKSIFEECRKKEIKLAIATARPCRTAKNYLDEIKGDAAIYLNGALVKVENNTIHSATIPFHSIGQILKGIKQAYPEATLSVEMNDSIYTDFIHDGPWEYSYIDFKDLPEYPADKVIIGSVDINRNSEINNMIPEGLYSEVNSGKFIMIMNKNATKLTGVQKLSHFFGIDMKEIAAFGDDYNDIGMLSACGIGVAMDDACNEAKEKADYITGNCDEEGVSEFIKKHLL